MALTPQERQEVISTLVANCDCWKHEGQREILNNLPDDTLENLHSDSERHVTNASIVEMVTNGISDEEAGVAFRLNAETGKLQYAMLTDNQYREDEEDEEEPPPSCPPTKGKKGKMTMNRDMSEEEFWRIAPPSLREQHKKLVANERRTRKSLIEKLVANIADEDAAERQAAIYNKLTTDDLEEMVNNAPVAGMVDDGLPPPNSDVADFSGVGVPTFNRGGGISETEELFVSNEEQPESFYDRLRKKELSRNGG